MQILASCTSCFSMNILLSHIFAFMADGFETTTFDFHHQCPSRFNFEECQNEPFFGSVLLASAMKVFR